MSTMKSPLRRVLVGAGSAAVLAGGIAYAAATPGGSSNTGAGGQGPGGPGAPPAGASGATGASGPGGF
ncbi:MAG TPA: hypothetical protein VHE83_03875, partial [Mycobacteriales bacterium]|nr:hypothetical protein [Mycobacteriales bacterium]